MTVAERPPEAKEWFGHFQKAAAEIKELRAQLADERARNQHDRDLVRELTAELHRLRGCEHTPDWHAGLTWCTNCGRSTGGAAGDDRREMFRRLAERDAEILRRLGDEI